MYFQNDLDAINNARQNHQGHTQQHVISNVGRRQLKEQRISPKDLIELDAETYTEMKNQGLSIEQVRQNKHKALDQDEFNFNIQFMKPQNGKYQRKQVFLPDKNTKYSDLNFNKSQQHNVQGGLQGQNTYTTYSNSNVKTNLTTYQQPMTQTSYTNNQVYTSNRFGTPHQTRVQSSMQYTPQQHVVQSGQQVVRRTYHKSNGEVVDVTNDPQYQNL